MKKIILLILTLLILCSCKTNNPDTIDDNYRVMYQIFVGSFSDSNNDGVGDLNGIINRLDYLNDGNIDSKKSLGIQGLWLTPIFESPSYHKYDVIDYYKIDPQFGSMEDLQKLIEECHSRNVIVILDMVLNHTSRVNEWFLEFSKAHHNNDVNNYYYDFYTYKDNYAQLPGRAWCPIESTNQEYECNFSPDMPELNLDNENVKKEILDIAKYYLDMGIDGFRFDAAKFVYYGDNKSSIDFWNWYVKELKKIKPDVYTVAEVWSSESEILDYINELNCFDFTLAGAEGIIADSVKNGNANSYVNYIANYQKKLRDKNNDVMMIPFLSNHDMDRSAGFLLMMNKYPYLAANLLLLTPGSPFIYYGEEIAIKGSRGGANTDANRRVAMLWGDDDTVKDPEGTTFDAKKQVNGTVLEQEKNEDSILNYYRKVIKVRNKYPEIARGNYEVLISDNKSLGGFIISYNNEKTLLLHNCSKTDELSIDISSYNFQKIKEVIGLSDAKLENGKITIGPMTSVIVK